MCLAAHIWGLAARSLRARRSQLRASPRDPYSRAAWAACGCQKGAERHVSQVAGADDLRVAGAQRERGEGNRSYRRGRGYVGRGCPNRRVPRLQERGTDVAGEPARRPHTIGPARRCRSGCCRRCPGARDLATSPGVATHEQLGMRAAICCM